MSRRQARVTLAGLLAAVTFVILPFGAFVWVAVVVLLAAAFGYAAHWHELAVFTQAELFNADFEIEGLRIDLRNMTDDYDSTLGRLSEVLDEHALCPVPVDPKPEISIVQPLRVVAIGKVPTQRRGGEV